MVRRTTRFVLVLAALAALLVAGGCASSSTKLVDEGRTYDRASALRLAASIDSGDLADRSSQEAATLRHDALVDLRKQGATGAAAASLITKTFPTDTAAVPFYVERAAFDSRPVFVVIEALGPKDGPLRDKRVWVLSDSGEVLLSGTR